MGDNLRGMSALAALRSFEAELRAGNEYYIALAFFIGSNGETLIWKVDVESDVLADVAKALRNSADNLEDEIKSRVAGRA
jgi:hypothetical protein